MRYARLSSTNVSSFAVHEQNWSRTQPSPNRRFGNGPVVQHVRLKTTYDKETSRQCTNLEAVFCVFGYITIIFVM